MQKLLSLENSVHTILSFEKYVTQMSPTISQNCLSLTPRFSITRQVICSGIAAISSFLLCLSSTMFLGLEMKTLLWRYPHKKE